VVGQGIPEREADHTPRFTEVTPLVWLVPLEAPRGGGANRKGSAAVNGGNREARKAGAQALRWSERAAETVLEIARSTFRSLKRLWSIRVTAAAHLWPGAAGTDRARQKVAGTGLSDGSPDQPPARCAKYKRSQKRTVQVRAPQPCQDLSPNLEVFLGGQYQNCGLVRDTNRREYWRLNHSARAGFF
jgi:hypothetical protein